MSSAAAGSPACHRRAPFGDDTQGRHWLTRMHAHSLFMICAEQMIRNTLGLAGGCASSKNTVVTFASAFLAAACAAALRFASAQRAVTFGRGTMRMMDPDSKEPACSSGRTHHASFVFLLDYRLHNRRDRSSTVSHSCLAISSGRLSCSEE